LDGHSYVRAVEIKSKKKKRVDKTIAVIKSREN
jgi:hypothetical protein